MNDRDLAFEVPQGIILKPALGQDGVFLTAGSTSPLSFGASIQAKFLPGDIHLQSTASGFIIWKKFDTGNTDWREYSAQDLRFDPDPQGFDPSIIDTQAAIDLLKSGGGSGVSGTVVGGKTGNLTIGSYFDNQGVPMNITPFDLSLKNVLLRTVTFRNENVVTGTVDIEYYDTGTLSWVVGYSISLTASNTAIIRGLAVTFPDEPQLRYKTNVAIKNPKLVANFNGDSAT